MKLVIHSRFHRSYSRIKHRKTNGTGVKVKLWTNKDLRKWIASSLGSGRESRKSTIPRRRSLLLCSPFFQTFLCPSCPNTVRMSGVLSHLFGLGDNSQPAVGYKLRSFPLSPPAPCPFNIGGASYPNRIASPSPTFPQFRHNARIS